MGRQKAEETAMGCGAQRRSDGTSPEMARRRRAIPWSGPEQARQASYRLGMDLLERITIDPAVRFGKPCVRGTRLTVGDVLGTLASGCTEAELLEDFPQLSHEDVLACLAFAAERERRLMTTTSVE